MKRLIGIFFLILILAEHVSGQTTVIPDTNFRKFLVQKFPTYLNASQQLINAQAAKYTGSLDCSGLNISNLTGIEKFTKLTELYCYNNTISNLDSVKNLADLTNLYCYNNPLKSLPSLSKMTKLSQLSCGLTQLTALPDLSTNTSLTIISCFTSQITAIPGLSKLVNLQNLLCYENPLKTIEDLSNLKNLNTLMCFSNELTDIPGLSKLTALQTLIAGNNPIVSFPDISNLTQMWSLLIWNCNLTTPPDISKMKSLFVFDVNINKLTSIPDFKNNLNLRVLHAMNNQLDSLPDLSQLTLLDSVQLGSNYLRHAPDFSSSKATLKKLDLSNNFISDLPDLSAFAMLNTLYVQGNQLTFEDLIPITKNTVTKTFLYSPQDSIGEAKTISLVANTPFVFGLGIDKGLQTDTYTWSKNDTLVKTTAVDTLRIVSPTSADAGVYTCTVTNPALPNLILSSKPVTLGSNCVSLASLSFQTSDFDCNIGGRLSYQEASITGGTKPYQIKLISKTTTTELVPNGNLFSNLFENNYQLKATDKNGCSDFKDIQIGGKKSEDCDGIVIVADNNSNVNQLYLEEKGTAKIFNKTGKLVRTLQTPASWDGTLQDGELVPGFYMIEHNSRNLTVTVIK